VLLIAPQEQRAQPLELRERGSALQRKYKIYLDKERYEKELRWQLGTRNAKT